MTVIRDVSILMVDSTAFVRKDMCWQMTGSLVKVYNYRHIRLCD